MLSNDNDLVMTEMVEIKIKTGTIWCLFISQWLKLTFWLYVITLVHQIYQNKSRVGQPVFWDTSLLNIFQMVNATTLSVLRYTAISNSLCSLALRHKAILPFALTLHSCPVSMCVLRGQGALMRQDYEKSKPISISESWGMALCIQTCLIRLTQCDKGRVWYTTKDKAWTHCDSSWQPHVALSDCIRVCACTLLLVMPRLGSGVAILPMLQSGGPEDDLP